MGVRLDAVGAAAGSCPSEDTWPDLLQLPARMLLESVVTSAGAAEVAPTGPPVLVIGPGVVEGCAPGGLAAHRVPAGHISGGHLLAQPRRGPVGGRLSGVSAPARRRIRLRLGAGSVQRAHRGPQRGGGDPAGRPAAG